LCPSQGARTASAAAVDALEEEEHQLVYGELGVEALARLLDAVGVREGDVFLDIGAGDGALVFAAALLYPGGVARSIGLEIVPALVERSRRFREDSFPGLGNVELLLGDVHRWEEDAQVAEVLQSTSLAVCFATTWSRGSRGKVLPKLSRALGAALPAGARVAVVDGRLLEEDGFQWAGDLRIECLDTFPYSTASLFERTL